MTLRLRVLESYLRPVVVVLFLLYPGIITIAHESYGDFNPLWLVGELVLPIVMGLVVGRYWVVSLAASSVAWYFIALARGESWAVHDWHDHTAFQVVAVALFALLEALVIAFGVWVRRKLAPPPGADRVAERVGTIRSSAIFTSQVTFRELRWVIAVAVALFVGGVFASGVVSTGLRVAALATYFGGWFYVHRRKRREQRGSPAASELEA